MRHVAPGDRAQLRPRPSDPGWADTVAILARGPSRREPPCPLAESCGGCQWMHVDEASQRELRLGLVRDALVEAGASEAARLVRLRPGSGLRHRARLQAAVTGGVLRLGHHRPGGREVTDVPSCPVHAPELARASDAVRRALSERPPADLTGVEITALPASPGALVTLNPRDAPPESWRSAADHLLAEPGIVGVAVQAADGIAGAPHVVGRTPAGHPVAAAALGFVQADLVGADALADTVARFATGSGAARIVELHAGAGLLSWRTAARDAHVEASELHPGSVAAAHALPPPPRGSMRIRRARDTEVVNEASHADALIVDPPRSGVGAIAEVIARSGPPVVVGAWCDTRSLAIDAATLLAGGYRVDGAQAIDLFAQTRHVETVLRLVR